MRDFHLSGVDLPPEQQARYKAISQELSTLASQFEENLMDATNAWQKLLTDVNQLAGLPESALAQARQTAQAAGQEGWMITLQFPSYLAVMTYADQRELREEHYRAFATRASDQGPDAGHWDNTEVMEQILALRHEKAQLLGFSNYAEYSLATKMANSTDAVNHFLEDLARKSHGQAQRDLAELAAFAKSEFGVDSLQTWDISYYAEKCVSIFISYPRKK